MYSIDRIDDIWNLEVFLFGGVPEVAEAMYERPRDTHGSSDVRTTRDAVEGKHGRKSHISNGHREVLFEFVYDEATGDIIYGGATR